MVRARNPGRGFARLHQMRQQKGRFRMKLEIDTGGLKPQYAVVIAAIVALGLVIATSMAIVKIGISMDWPWLTEYVKGPKLQKVELLNCTQLYDRDTGAIIKESCRPPEQEAKIQELTANLRKLTGELADTNASLETAVTTGKKFDATIVDLRQQLKSAEERIEELQGKLQTAERDFGPSKTRECRIARDWDKLTEQQVICSGQIVGKIIPSQSDPQSLPRRRLLSEDIVKVLKECGGARNWTTGQCVSNAAPRWNSTASHIAVCDMNNVECLRREISVNCRNGSSRVSYDSTKPDVSDSSQRTVGFYCD